MVTETVKPKTKLGAALRSAVIPGLGQAWTTDYEDVSKKSWYFMGGEAAVGLLALLTYTNLNGANNKAVKNHTNYINATDINDIRTYKEQSESNLNKAESLEKQLELLTTVLMGVHVYNIVDAFLNGPSGEETAATKKLRIDLVYNPELNHPQLRFSIALD